MLENIEQFWLRFNQLSQREKIMVAGTFLLIFWGVWDNLFYAPLQKENRSVEVEIGSLGNQLNTQLQIAKQIENLSRNNPNATARQELTNLQQSVNNLKLRLGLGNKKFVPADSMANALSDILKQHGKLKLVRLETLPVTPFGGIDQEDAWMYQHSMVMTLQGDFFSTVDYLKALESLPWRILWDSIDYQVKDYPNAETRIQVYTLSFEKDWLGV